MDKNKLDLTDNLTLRLLKAEANESVNACVALETAILSQSPDWQRVLEERALRDKRLQLLNEYGARLREQYGLIDGDKIEADGTIVWAPRGN